MIAYNIAWDTDNVKVDNLPSMVYIPNDIIASYDIIDFEEVVNLLSDVYGYCIFSLEIKEA